MLWGFPWSCPWGDNDEMISSLKTANLRDGVRVDVIPADNCGQYYRLVVDGLAQGLPVFIHTGELAEMVGLYESTSSGHLVSVCPQGDWNTTDVDLSAQVQPFASGHARYFLLSLEPTVSLFSQGDGGQLTGWSMTGLERYTNVAPVNYRTNWGRIECTLADAAGTRSVVLTLRGTTLASGSIVGDGACTVAAINSTISGTVNVSWTGNVSGAVYAVWPARYAVHYQASGWTGADFPRTPSAYIYDDGTMQTGKYRSPALAGGTWYIVAHQVDDSLNESTGIMAGGSTLTIPGTPMPCTGLAYVSGNATNTQVLWFYGSGATGTYLYDSLSGGSGGIDLHTPTYITGNSGYTLTGISAGFSGKRYIIARGVLAGVDDGAGVALELSYSGGAVLLPQPPDVGLGNDIEVSGLTMRVRASINIVDAASIPSGVQLFFWETTGALVTGTPIATLPVSTGSNRVGTELVVTLSGAAAANGEYYYSARSVLGTAYSTSMSTRGPVRLTTVQPAQPASILVRAGA